MTVEINALNVWYPLSRATHAMKTNLAPITGGLLLFIKLRRKLFMKCKQTPSATISLLISQQYQSIHRLNSGMDN